MVYVAIEQGDNPVLVGSPNLDQPQGLMRSLRLDTEAEVCVALPRLSTLQRTGGSPQLLD